MRNSYEVLTGAVWKKPEKKQVKKQVKKKKKNRFNDEILTMKFISNGRYDYGIMARN